MALVLLRISNQDAKLYNFIWIDNDDHQACNWVLLIGDRTALIQCHNSIWLERHVQFRVWECNSHKNSDIHLRLDNKKARCNFS